MLHLGAHVRLGEEIGKGAAATVYKGRVVETGEVIAVKQVTGFVRLLFLLTVVVVLCKADLCCLFVCLSRCPGTALGGV